MSTIAEVEIPVAETVLRESLSTASDVTLEVVRVAAHNRDQLVPYIRTSGDDIDALDEALAEDPSVDNVQVLDDLGEERLYRMDWVDDVPILVNVLVDQRGTVLDMVASGDTWFLRLLLPDRNSLSAIHDYCRENDLTFDIKRIYELSESVGRGKFGLTAQQHEVLVTAAARGYFDVPRQVTMSELAEGLDVSQQALSERLRRGHKNLIDSALRVEEHNFGNAGHPPN